MLVVLAELDCLKTLKKRGVHPDKFFTDFDLFKKVAPTFNNAHILFILAGTSRFNKRLVSELACQLKARADNKGDNGVKSFTFLCDTTYIKVKPYFKYNNDLDSIDCWEEYSKIHTNVDFWSSFKTSERETELYLSSIDKGISDNFVESYKNIYSSEDELKRFIQVPDVKKLMSAEEGKVVGQSS